ncbi:nose resistant to fluoxetine protein 6-like isoform X1 [Centruroides sculpturatus]|uniref:nose resistant to fluoxetine protein 6-like isoform X1 n=1 Tax=Centruroides sculpturatus TaxID=218467 RepID=UPI000C6D43FD|nr:nose resistant to fluoxetine protein 6-like isoform X1 [Centruroides sculpturatus]
MTRALELILICLFLCTQTFSMSEVASEEVIENDEEVKKMWLDTLENVRYFTRFVAKFLKPRLKRLEKEVNITQECKESFKQFLYDLQNNKVWAFKMFDSWGKITPGSMIGSLTDYGSYYECKNAVHDTKEAFSTDWKNFSPRYCILDYRLPPPSVAKDISPFHTVPDFLNLTDKDSVQSFLANKSHLFTEHTFRNGICVPSSCSSEDIQIVFKKFLNKIGIEGIVKVSHCDSDASVALSTEQKVVIIFISSLILLSIIGTIMDLLQRRASNYDVEKQNSSLTKKMFLSFSLYTNAQKLFSSKKSSDTLTILHGLRVISISWIIYSHSHLYVDTQSIAGILIYKEFFKEYFYQFVANGTLSVDTFFFISGLLVSYNTITLVKKHKKKFNIPVFIIYRFFRLTPTYAVVIGILFVLPLLGDGPVWNLTLDPEVEKCRKGWWRNLLFINNFIESHNGCLDHSWYLATDTQLYMASLIVVIPLIRWSTLGLIINFTLLILSMIVTAFITYYMKLPPTALASAYLNPSDRFLDWSKVYYKPYPHAGAFCIGLATGYLLVKKPQLKLSKWILVLGWICTCVCSGAVLFSARDWNVGHKPSPWISALYASTNRTVWSLCVSWVVITSVYGYGGIVSKFLSCKLFAPFSRVCYCTYLIHPLILWVYNAQRRDTIYPTYFIWMYMIIGHIVLSFVCAFVISLVTESPFLALQSIIFGRNRKKSASNEFISQKNDIIVKEYNNTHVNIVCSSTLSLPQDKD